MQAIEEEKAKVLEYNRLHQDDKKKALPPREHTLDMYANDTKIRTEHDIENNSKADVLIKQYQNRYLEDFELDNSFNCLILRPPQINSLFLQELAKARGGRGNRFNDTNNIGYSKNSYSIYGKNDPVWYYFDNQLSSLNDAMKLIDTAFAKEVKAGFHHVKFYADFGIIIEEYLEDPMEYQRYRYKHETPIDRNTERTIPIIIKSDDYNVSRNKYKDIVKSLIISYQDRVVNNTKNNIIALYSMMIVSYRLPIAGGRASWWVNKHVKKLMTTYVDCEDAICCVDAMAKTLLMLHLNTTDKSVVKGYKGFSLADIKDFSLRYKVSVFLFMYNREKDVYYLDHELSSIDKDFKV
jgi:hypothetical protein